MSGSFLITLGSVLTGIGATTVIVGNLVLWLWLNAKDNQKGRK